MSTRSIEKILSEEDKLSSKNLDCILRKNISDISLDDLKQIEKIAIFKDNVTVQEIKEIENMLGSRVLEIDKDISNIRLWLGKTHIKNEQNWVSIKQNKLSNVLL